MASACSWQLRIRIAEPSMRYAPFTVMTGHFELCKIKGAVAQLAAGTSYSPVINKK